MVSEISAVRQHHAFAPGNGKSVAGLRSAESQRDVGSPSSVDGDDVPGVLRNLADGHYKGVADVRLRIVHADRIAELQAVANQHEAAALQASLEAGLGAAVDSFAAELAASDMAAGGSATDAVEAFKEAIANPEADLAAAISDLEEALYASLDASDAGEVTGETSGTSADDPIATLIASLRDIVETSASEATDQLLPPLSSYSGGGKAYARFLELYQAMMNADAQSSIPEQPAQIIELTA